MNFFNKKSSLVILCLLFTVRLYSQNLQIHYDHAEERQYFTSTLEFFRPDERGATFWFVDFDYNQPGNRSASLAYWEIARYINLPGKKGLAATAQFNDGTAPWGPLGHVWLAGLAHPINLGFTSISTELLYRSSYQSKGHDGQLTFVFSFNILGGKGHITGFADIWSETKEEVSEKQIVLLSQPQLWYEFSNNIYLGGEARLSQNFLPEKGLQVYTTIGIKWEME